MNKKLLPIARLCGDISFAINGENKTSFSLAGEWVNNHSATFTGDQGCVYPNNKTDEDISALGATVRALSNLKVVPYQNDSSYEKYATDEAQEWLTKTLPAELSKQFRDNPDVFKVQAGFTGVGETEPSIVVSVEVTTNQYANAIFESLKDITFLGNVKSVTMSDEGSIAYVYVDEDGNENTVTRGIDDKTTLLGLDSFKAATKLFTADSEILVVTSDHFNPVIEESKFVKI